MKIFNKYINEVVKVKDETAASGRNYLKNFLTEFTIIKNIKTVHDGKRGRQCRGAVDFNFILTDNLHIL